MAEVIGIEFLMLAEVFVENEERFLALVTSLSEDEWEKPTACPLWNVRQILAHVTGAAASYARWSEFKRQNSLKVRQ